MAVRVQMNAGWQTELTARFVDPALTRLLHHIADDARRYAPVETGALEAGIHVEDSVGGKGAVVSSREVPGDDPDVPVYVEYGTQNMAAQPYMRPAAYQRRSL